MINQRYHRALRECGWASNINQFFRKWASYRVNPSYVNSVCSDNSELLHSNLSVQEQANIVPAFVSYLISVAVAVLTESWEETRWEERHYTLRVCLHLRTCWCFLAVLWMCERGRESWGSLDTRVFLSVRQSSARPRPNHIMASKVGRERREKIREC